MIVQTLGIITIIASVIMHQQKSKEKFLLMTLFVFTLLTIQYFLTDKLTGAIVSIIIIIRAIVYYFYKKKGLKPSVRVFVAFTIVMLISGYFTWYNWLSILPLITGIVTGWGVWQDNMRYTRRTLMVGRISLLAYNFTAGMYTAMISKFIEMVSIGIAMWRYDRKKSRVEGEK